MIDRPSFVEHLMDGVLEVYLKAVDVFAERVPIDAYYSGDDWCDQRGPIMGLRLWRRFIKPCLAQLIDRCHAYGLAFIYHSVVTCFR